VPKTRAATKGAAAKDDQAVDCYSRMHLIRRFEEEMQRLFLKGEIHGTTHLCIGQEAIPVGVCAALEPDDWAAGTYRGHGHALAKGTDPGALAAEMLGRATGVCGGRSGSMNVIDLDHRLMGCYGIVGASMGAALGAALAGRREGRVAVAFFGDGATNQAYFHESMNFAAIKRLPVLFVCENNLYGEFTPLAASTAGGDIEGRAAAYGMHAVKVDGNDLWAVRAAAEEAAERGRAGEGPTLLECLTYRHLGHSKSDPGAYRPKEEVELWKERDPLPATRRRLVELGFSEEVVDGAEQRAADEISQAVADALAAPYPDPAQGLGQEFSS
jgi:acetoin:2,6-dichlorophenolindophenol oxidoreductase subunit alpha